jgi:hypothetical protein
LNNIDANIRQNELAHISNSELGYDILDIDNHRFIITNEAMLNTEWLQFIRDLAVDIKVETVYGNTINTLTIDTEVANSLFEDILEWSVGSQLEYENELRAIRDATVVSSSPEFREMFESINGGTALTILDVSPTSPSKVIESTIENMRELEWRNLIRAD